MSLTYERPVLTVGAIRLFTKLMRISGQYGFHWSNQSVFWGLDMFHYVTLGESRVLECGVSLLVVIYSP